MTTAPPPIIHLQFQLTPQDYVRANWVSYRSARLMWVIWIFLGPFMLLAGIYRYFDEVGHPLTFPLFLGWIFMIIFPLTLIISPRTAFKKQPSLAAPQTFTASSDGIIVKSPLFSGNDAWSMYVSFVESKDMFLLYLSPRMFRMIPKRAFQSDEQMQEFRRLVAQHVPPRGPRWTV